MFPTLCNASDQLCINMFEEGQGMYANQLSAYLG